MGLSEQRKALIGGVIALLIFADGNLPDLASAVAQDWVAFGIKGAIATFMAYYGVWVAPNETATPLLRTHPGAKS